MTPAEKLRVEATASETAARRLLEGGDRTEEHVRLGLHHEARARLYLRAADTAERMGLTE